MKVSPVTLIAIGLAYASPVLAQSQDEVEAPPPQAVDTLMFTIDELNDIQSRVAASGAGDDEEGRGDPDAIEQATLYVSTILYYGPNDWTAWINGVPIGPNQELSSFEITDISPSFVELLVPLSAQGMRPIRLSPNQTFVARSGTVVEGKWP